MAVKNTLRNALKQRKQMFELPSWISQTPDAERRARVEELLTLLWTRAGGPTHYEGRARARARAKYPNRQAKITKKLMKTSVSFPTKWLKKPVKF